MTDRQISSDREKDTFSDHEKKVIAILREIKYGEVKVVVQDGVPVRVDEIRKSIKI